MFEHKIRKAYHARRRVIRREAVLCYQLVALVDTFLENYETDANSKATHQSLNDLANVLMVSSLTPQELDAINSSLMYATFNQLIRKSLSSALVELTLLAILTGYHSYGAFRDDIRDIGQPILDIFGQLSRKSKDDALWCLSNILSHKEVGQLLELIDRSSFVPELNQHLHLLILSDEFNDDSFSSVALFGNSYLYNCRLLPAEPDESLAGSLKQVGAFILKKSLLNNFMDDDVFNFIEELLQNQLDIFKLDEGLLELTLGQIKEDQCAHLMIKIVQANSQSRVIIFERILGHLGVLGTKVSVLEQLMNILNCIFDESESVTRRFLIELLENKMKVDELLLLMDDCNYCDSYQQLVSTLIQQTERKQRYLPLLEQLDRKSMDIKLSNQLLYIIDHELNDPFH